MFSIEIKFVKFLFLLIFCFRLQKLFGGKVFVGLRIPDADSASPQTIDLVLLTKRYYLYLFMFPTLLIQGVSVSKHVIFLFFF